MTMQYKTPPSSGINPNRLAVNAMDGRVEISISNGQDGRWVEVSPADAPALASAILEAAGQPAWIGDATVSVLADVAAERARQDAKWGEQNHPDRSRYQSSPTTWPAIFRRPFAECADMAKLQVDHEAKIDESNYTSIFLEEVFEALAETDQARLRKELVQVAAVAVQWVEAIDRRAERGQ